jgi:hypothetical protein
MRKVGEFMVQPIAYATDGGLGRARIRGQYFGVVCQLRWPRKYRGRVVIPGFSDGVQELELYQFIRAHQQHNRV